MSDLQQELGVLAECIRLSIQGKIVVAHCTTCGAMVGASISVDRLRMAINVHGCVIRSIVQSDS